MPDQLVHDRLRAPVVVAKQKYIAALAFDDGGNVGGAMLLSEDHQIRFPVTEFTAGIDDVGPVSNGAFHWKDEASGSACVSWSPPAASFGQVPAQLLILAFLRIDVLIDCLMAQPSGRATGKPQPTRNLFRRPAVLEAIDNGGTQTGIT